MKRMIAILMAVVLCLSMAAVTAAADGGAVSVTSASAERGEQVSLTISVSSAEFAFLQLSISYNASALKVVDCSSSVRGFTKGNPASSVYTPLWSGAENVTVSGTIATITFEVLADAPKGSYPISVGVAECYDQNLDDVAVTGGSGTITVTIPPCASHTWDEGKVTTAATCEGKGVKTYTCSVCGETKTEDIPSLGGHAWDGGKVTTAATCEGTGVKTYTCTACGATKTEDISALGHTWDGGKVTTAATCEGKGVKTYTCAACSKTKTEDIPSLGGHAWDGGKVTTAATCEGTGVKTYTCTACGATKTEDISALGHTWDEGKVTTAATCEGKGVKTYTCAACSKTKTEDIPSLGGHAWDGGKVTTEATCEGTGVKTYTCTVCGATKTEDISALGHSWGAWTPVENKDTHSRKCANCTNVEEEAHKWDEGKVTKEATCSDDGEKTYTCADCKATKTEVIPATNEHDYTDHYEYAEGEKVHYGYCVCGKKGPAEEHAYTQEGDVLEKPTTTKEGKQEKLCVCGDKIVVTLDKVSAEYDKVPKTGDITDELLVMGAVVLLGIGGIVCLLKRKIVR